MPIPGSPYEVGAEWLPRSRDNEDYAQCLRKELLKRG